MFRLDAENEEVSIPIRIEAYFYAAFHFIEAMAGRKGFHVEKHQRVRSFLEKNNEILKNETEKVWRSFHEIENQIRPGQIYGGQINGHKLRRNTQLVQDLDGKYIGGGLFTIPQKNVQAMEEWLEESKVEFKRLDMWLAEDDIIKIRA